MEFISSSKLNKNVAGLTDDQSLNERADMLDIFQSFFNTKKSPIGFHTKILVISIKDTSNQSLTVISLRPEGVKPPQWRLSEMLLSDQKHDNGHIRCISRYQSVCRVDPVGLFAANHQAGIISSKDKESTGLECFT